MPIVPLRGRSGAFAMPASEPIEARNEEKAATKQEEAEQKEEKKDTTAPAVAEVAQTTKEAEPAVSATSPVASPRKDTIETTVTGELPAMQSNAVIGRYIVLFVCFYFLLY